MDTVLGSWAAHAWQPDLRLLVRPNVYCRRIMVPCLLNMYRFDASGFIVEHYSDGDVVNNQTKMTRQVATPANMATWGPNVSRAMLTGRIEDAEKFPVTGHGGARPAAVPTA